MRFFLSFSRVNSLTLLFSRIPFYRAKEATEAIRPKLGNLYHRDDRSFLGQLWSVFTTCKYVEKDPNVPGAMRWANLPGKKSN